MTNKYIVTTLAAIIAATVVSFAQSYSIVPNDTIRITGLMEDLQTLSIQQVNISTDTIILKWKKISESVPSKWEALVCDNSFCNASLVDSGTMSPVFPNEYGLLLLHITPHFEFGTAIVRYEVWDNASPLLKDTLTYILTAVETLGMAEGESTNCISISPNPVKENFTIRFENQNGYVFSIVSFTGKVIQTGIFEANSISVSTENYPNGSYFVSIFDKKNNIDIRKFIVQH